MGSQIPALEKLFDEWAKKHAEKLSTGEPYLLPEQEEPYGGFVRDGIVNLESWKQQKVRICFILNEAGGRFDMEHYPDGFDLAAEWNEKGSFSKFMFKLAVWTKAIQDAFSPPITYKKSDVSKIRDDLIRSIAIVNIKKSDGQRRSDFSVLQRFANEDAEELKRELELVNPNIIICGENLKFLREPFIPKPPKKKEGEEGSDTTVAPAESETKIETVEPIVKVESTESEQVAEFKPVILPPFREDGKRNYVFLSSELKQVSKFTYIWGSKLVFSMWTPANFMGTISSNTLNYYAVREIVRASLKAFGDKQRKQKIHQMAEQRHQEKLKLKQERLAQKQAKEAAQQGSQTDAKTATATTPKPAAEVKPATAATPTAEIKPATTPKPTAEVKPAPAPKVETAATPEAEVKPKTTRTRTKKVTADGETKTETKPKTTRAKKTKTEPAAE